MPTYADADALRTELALAEADLSDDAAALLLEDAEDLIDRIVVSRYTYPETGRAFEPADLSDFQAAKLARATVKLAAAAQRDVGAFAPPAADTIKGPVFELSGIRGGMSPAGELALRAAAALLDQARLRNLTARARA